MVKKEISSVQNWKEAFWETALCSVNSSHRVTSFPSRSLSLRLFLWNWQRDIWKPLEGYGEKGNIFRSNLERSFLRNCFVIFYLHSLSYSYISWSCLLVLFLWNLRPDISDRFEGYTAKGNSPDKSKKEVFWEMSFWSLISSHRVPPFCSCSCFLTLFSWTLQSDISEHIQGYSEKGNIFR